MTDFAHHFALVAAGKLTTPSIIAPLIKRHPKIIAVDHGLAHLHTLNISPQLIIGDFDSLDPTYLTKYKHVPQKSFPKDKDESDLELALNHAFTHGATKVTIYTALEGRTDHILANLLLLTKRPGAIFIESEIEIITAVTGTMDIFAKAGQTISLFAIGDKAEDVTTTGLKWEIKHKTIDTSFYSLSNVAEKNNVRIKVGSGIVIVCIQK